MCCEPGSGSTPEAGGGGGLFVIEDLGVDEAGPVIQGGVEEAVTSPAVAMVQVRSSPVEPPPATRGDRSELLDVDVDELARVVPLVAAHGPWIGRSITTIEWPHAGCAQDVLHRRCRQPDLERDPVGAPPSLPPQQHDPASEAARRPVRRASRSARPVDEPRLTLGHEPVPPLADGLCVDLEPFRRRLDGPATVEHAGDHPAAPDRGQHRVGVLASSVRHEPSLRDVRCGRPTASLGGLTSSVDQPHHPATDNVPGHHS
jgi:hypothetical protein